jgi:hypothetical protein
MADELFFVAYMATQLAGWLLISKGLWMFAEIVRDVWIYCQSIAA